MDTFQPEYIALTYTLEEGFTINHDPGDEALIQQIEGKIIGLAFDLESEDEEIRQEIGQVLLRRVNCFGVSRCRQSLMEVLDTVDTYTAMFLRWVISEEGKQALRGDTDLLLFDGILPGGLDDELRLEAMARAILTWGKGNVVLLQPASAYLPESAAQDAELLGLNLLEEAEAEGDPLYWGRCKPAKLNKLIGRVAV